MPVDGDSTPPGIGPALTTFLAASAHPAFICAAPALDDALNRRITVSKLVDPESLEAQANTLGGQTSAANARIVAGFDHLQPGLARRSTEQSGPGRPAGPLRGSSWTSDGPDSGVGSETTDSTASASYPSARALTSLAFSELVSPQKEAPEAQWPITLTATDAHRYVYPHITGSSADRGRGASLRELTTAVWGNEAYRKLLNADGTARNCLFDLLGGGDGVKLAALLAEACAAFRNGPTAPSSLRVGLQYESSPGRLSIAHRDAELDIVATRADEAYLVVTCILRGTLPGTPAVAVESKAKTRRPDLRRTPSIISADSIASDGSLSRKRRAADVSPEPDVASRDVEMEDGADTTPHARRPEFISANSVANAVAGAISQRVSHSPPSATQDPLIGLMHETTAGQQILAFPWETTSVGHISTWSGELRACVARMLRSPWREALWVGEDMVIMYGEAFRSAGLSKDGWLMGQRGSVGYAEIWQQLASLVPGVQRGKTELAHDSLLFLVRDGGRLQESYFSWSWIPQFDPTGRFVAASNPSYESTARVVAERRLGTLRDVVQTTALARRVPDFCKSAIDGLSRNPYDIPFAMMYSINQAARSSSTRGSSRLSHVQISLEAAIGVPEAHASVPSSVRIRPTVNGTPDASSSSSGASNSTVEPVYADDASLPWPFHEAISSLKPVFVQDAAARLHGFKPRGWDEQCRSAIVLPIGVNEEDDHPQALLIVGLNPRLPWDETQAIFFQLLARQLATGLTTVISYEQAESKALEMAALDRAKSAFFSNSSHELRTPLTLILGPLEDVLRDRRALPPSARNVLQICHRNAQRLLSLVDALLDFAKVEAGRVEALFVPIKLGALVANLASLFRSAIERSGISYIVSIEETAESPLVYTDVALFERVVNNLLSNAAKYTQSGTIEIALRYTSSEAVLSVTDSGCGIAESEQRLIFNRFHRVEGTSHSVGGTGIGLAFASEIVRILGGQIGVKSEVNKGSTFFVRLQLGSAHLDPDRIRPAPPETPAPPSFDPSSAEDSDWVSQQLDIASTSISNDPETDIASGEVLDAQGPAAMLNVKRSTILVVDDNSDMRSYLRSVLPTSFSVFEAADGLLGLEEARCVQPDLIISDIMMPRMNGIELIAALRNDRRTALVPVILLSARAGPEARVDGLMSGADDYLAKPFSARELVARVHTHLQLGKIRKELESRVSERTAALAESERNSRDLAAKLSTIADLCGVGIFFASSDAKILWANARYQEMIGRDERDEVVWPCSTLYTHPEDRQVVSDLWWKAVHDKVPATFEFRHSKQGKPDYATFQVSIRPQPVHGEFCIVGSLTDITAAKLLEQQHIEAVEERAKEATRLRKLQELSIDVSSHELRNPLSGILQNSELVAGSLARLDRLLSDYNGGRIANHELITTLAEELAGDSESIESIIICARHQRRICDDILSFSKLNMGLFELAPAPFNPIELARGAIRMFATDANQRGVRLDLDIDPSVEALRATSIVADPTRLAQVVINCGLAAHGTRRLTNAVMTNALRYSAESNGKRVAVAISAVTSLPPVRAEVMRVAAPDLVEQPTDGVWLIVEVTDTGPGLGPEEISRLFHRFAQANPQIDSLSGFGLGLFVSRKIIELHQGMIEVASQKGQGSTFRFGIPTPRAPHAGPTAPIDSASALTSLVRRNSSLTVATRTGPSATGSSAGRVLIVEDNVINSKVLNKQLTLKRFATASAFNGLKALEALNAVEHASALAERPPFDLVLMDIEMPVMDGMTAIRRLRAVEEAIGRPRLPVVAVTGNARQEQIDSCLAAGFDAVAVKPYDMHDLELTIHRLMAAAAAQQHDNTTTA